LPSILKVALRARPAGEWIDTSVRRMVEEAESGKPGSSALLSKMAEALFIESLRAYAEGLPSDQSGWLAASRDPIVGAALALLHGAPRQRWSVEKLASRVGASRSVLIERFDRFLGESPMRYLAKWRMQLAARSLETTSHSVLTIANDVGYESEAAFNRAFNRAFGVPPAAFRRRRRGTPPERSGAFTARRRRAARS
jgi:transcriptional regulator GlxA family with amidase domain